MKPTPGHKKSGDFVLITPSTASNESLTATPDNLTDPSRTLDRELEFVEEPISNPPLHQKTAALLTQPQTSISSPTNPGEASRSAKRLGKTPANGEFLGRKGYNLWSAFNPVWGSYRVVKARLPRPSDREVDWVKTIGRPDDLGMFLASRNPVNRSTVTWLEQCLKGDIKVGSFILHGPAGCGKSALIKVFLAQLLEDPTSNPVNVARLHSTRVLTITPEELTVASKTVSNRVRKFLAAKNGALPDIVPRFVVVDGLERVPAQAQQALLSLTTEAEKSGGTARMQLVLTTRELSKVILALGSSAKLLEVQTVDIADGVRILLRILHHESVGYEILAVKALFRKFWPDLGRCIVVSQQVFCDKHYLSEVNVLKEVDPKGLREYTGKARRIKPWDALEPLARCPKCTLRPPCCHISEQELIARGMQRRAELPQRRLHDGDGIDVAGDSTNCKRFMKQGACRVFNQFGRCNFHHPLDVHVVDIPPARCPQCTIRLPCNHCGASAARSTPTLV